MPGWKPKGAGADMPDTLPDRLWDRYQTRETTGADALPTNPPSGWQPRNLDQSMGMGGEGGMGAGGVYVKYPDGSMHWDETRIDPGGDAGGSVVDPGGNIIPGANRQSGSTGPGGTGPAGSQARAAHVGELMQNPSFISKGGGSMFGAANQPGWQPGMLLDKQAALDWGSPVQAPGVRTNEQLGIGKPLQYADDIMGTGGEGGMGAGATFTVPIVDSKGKAGTITVNANDAAAAKNNAYQGGNTPTGNAVQTQATGGSSGGSSGGGGGGGGSAPAQQNVISAAQQAQLAIDKARVDNEAKAEENRHNEALAKIQQDYEKLRNENQRQIEINAETQRHNQVTEDNTRRGQDIQLQMNQLDNQTKLQIEAMSNAAAKELESMKEANSVLLEQMQEGNKILMEQGQEAFKDWQTRQESLMSILGSALNNPWLQQLSGMAPPGQEAPVMGGGNIQGLLQKIMAPYDWSKAFGAAGSAAPPPGSDALSEATAGSQVPGGQQGAETQTPSYAQWQGWSPFQKAAYRANIESLGPGAWQTQQAAAQNRFASEGGSPDITPLAGMSASPLENIGQQMTANMFGQTTDQWQKQQERQWSQSQAPQVKQSLRTGVTQPTAAASVTPEQQFGI